HHVLAGQVDRGGDTAFQVPVVVQLDLDVVPLGELADHVQTHTAGDRDVDLRRLGQAVVDLREVRFVHADAAVADLHDQLLLAVGGAHVDLGVRVGEHGGVLQQLGHQVHEVVDHAALQGQVGGVGDVDARVLLHLGDRG